MPDSDSDLAELDDILALNRGVVIRADSGRDELGFADSSGGHFDGVVEASQPIVNSDGGADDAESQELGMLVSIGNCTSRRKRIRAEAAADARCVRLSAQLKRVRSDASAHVLTSRQVLNSIASCFPVVRKFLGVRCVSDDRTLSDGTYIKIALALTPKLRGCLSRAAAQVSAVTIVAHAGLAAQQKHLERLLTFDGAATYNTNDSQPYSDTCTVSALDADGYLPKTCAKWFNLVDATVFCWDECEQKMKKFQRRAKLQVKGNVGPSAQSSCQIFVSNGSFTRSVQQVGCQHIESHGHVIASRPRRLQFATADFIIEAATISMPIPFSSPRCLNIDMLMMMMMMMMMPRATIDDD